jgi:hypothetical protein
MYASFQSVEVCEGEQNKGEKITAGGNVVVSAIKILVTIGLVQPGASLGHRNPSGNGWDRNVLGDYIHKVPVFWHDNLQCESRKTHDPPTSVI